MCWAAIILRLLLLITTTHKKLVVDSTNNSDSGSSRLFDHGASSFCALRNRPLCVYLYCQRQQQDDDDIYCMQRFS